MSKDDDDDSQGKAGRAQNIEVPSLAYAAEQRGDSRRVADPKVVEARICQFSRTTFTPPPC
jgi:hypothetical protein